MVREREWPAARTRILLLLMVFAIYNDLVRLDAFRISDRTAHDHTAEDEANRARRIKIGGGAPVTVHR